MKNLLTLLIMLSFSLNYAQSATGDIEVYLGNIIDNLPGSSGDDYSEPSTIELSNWDAVITHVLDENISAARTTATNLNYQVTEFTDTSLSPNQVFYVLEEKDPQLKYWGTYVFSKTPTRENLIIQAPHSKFDTNTGKQALHCFKNTMARGVFLNGAHRCNSERFSSCSGSTGVCGMSGESYRISDLAHATNAIFQKTTENVLTAISNSVFIQLHGFSKQSSDPSVIMSNGTRETPSTDYTVLLRDALLAEDPTLTFEIAHINTNWTRLIGFTNTQGRLINNVADPCDASATTTTGRFIHIEQERTKLRDNSNVWAKMSNALAGVFESTLSSDVPSLNSNISTYPNPTNNGVTIKGIQIRKVQVYNISGLLIKTLNKVPDEVFIDFKGTPKGVYFLRIETSTASKTEKIMVR